jgi:DNA-binding winged helix-turn-helix (wHTH) protein
VQHTVYLFDGFQLDVTRRKLISSGGLVQSLHSRAMEVLLLLVTNAGELVEKRRLMQTVWPNAIVEDNNLTQCVLAIRKALGETAGSNRYVMTVPGRGYRFVSPVRAVVQESGSETAPPAPQRRSPYAMWLGISTTICALLIALVLWRIAVMSEGPPLALATTTDASSEMPQTLVLRLLEPSVGNGSRAAAHSMALLAQCLEAQPGMKLRVQVQLVAEQGAPLWAGRYIADARDLPALQPGDDAAAACRDFAASRQAAPSAVSARGSR